jgi:hypothetical protein
VLFDVFVGDLLDGDSVLLANVLLDLVLDHV